MRIIVDSIGCFSAGPATLPPPQLGSAARRLDSPTARRVRQATPPGAPGEVVPALPDGLEPPVASCRWKYILLHHSATGSGSVASINAAHRRRRDLFRKPWLGIGYHFVIGNGRGMDDGRLVTAFRWRQQLHRAHADDRLHNDEGIDICLIGDFHHQPPTDLQISCAKSLIQSLRTRYNIGLETVVAHREVTATQCPGKHFPFQQIIGRSLHVGHSFTRGSRYPSRRGRVDGMLQTEHFSRTRLTNTLHEHSNTKEPWHPA